MMMMSDAEMLLAAGDECWWWWWWVMLRCCLQLEMSVDDDDEWCWDVACSCGVVYVCVQGLPMKLTYFVGPYDLLNHRTLRPTPMTIEGMLSCLVCAPVLLCIFSLLSSGFDLSQSRLLVIVTSDWPCLHVPVNTVWRWTESTSRSGWWRSHMAGICSDCSTHEIINK